jgi:hypothetical protein
LHPNASVAALLVNKEDDLLLAGSFRCLSSFEGLRKF